MGATHCNAGTLGLWTQVIPNTGLVFIRQIEIYLAKAKIA